MKFSLKQKQFIDTAIGLPLLLLNKMLTIALGKILRRDHALSIAPKKIVIIKILGLGSVIMATDALVSIKKKYPHSSFEIICSASIGEGVASLNLFDKVHLISDSSFHRTIFSSIKVLSNFWLDRCWVIDLEVYSKLSSLLSLWTIAINRFGFYFDAVPFRNNVNTHNIFFDTTANVTDNYKRMAEALAVISIEKYIIKGFEHRDINQKYTYIAINNTCSELARERLLTKQQMKEVCAWIIDNTNYKIALLGAPSDRRDMEAFISEMKMNKIENFAGSFSFSNYYQFLHNECKVMLTVDSAPLHIAQKLNMPTLSIWGPTTPQSRIEVNQNNKIIFHNVVCTPCAHISGALPCKGNNFCIKEIKGAEIIQELNLLL